MKLAEALHPQRRVLSQIVRHLRVPRMADRVLVQRAFLAVHDTHRQVLPRPELLAKLTDGELQGYVAVDDQLHAAPPETTCPIGLTSGLGRCVGCPKYCVVSTSYQSLMPGSLPLNRCLWQSR